MKHIIFYEKNGCGGNARQKALLEENGFTIETRSLLDTPWTVEQLRPFFGEKPVSQWFNDKAPAVKSAHVCPSTFNEESALEIMIESPILIRRPLLEYNGKKASGFDEKIISEFLEITSEKKDLEQCQHSKQDCLK